jgi:tetratricopeptide (TPR) repeat protein
MKVQTAGCRDRVGRSRWGLAAALLFSTAAHSAAATIPLDSNWRRLRSQHFILTTDHSEDSARASLLSLERTRAMLLSGVWGSSTLAGAVRTHVVVLAHDTDFERYFGRTTSGLTTELGGVPTILLYGRPDRWTRGSIYSGTTSVLKHELTHQLANAIYGRQPRWFAEGLAQFAETLEPAEDEKTAILGRPNLDALQKYRGVRSVRMRDLFAWTSDVNLEERARQGRYGLAWGAVYWMYNAQPEAFLRYQQALQAGRDPEQAWKNAFPGLTPEQADGLVHQYLSHGDYKEFVVPLVTAEAALTPEPLTQADAWAVQAEISLAAGRWRDDPKLLAESEERFRRALALDPGQLEAVQFAADLTPVERLAGARSATRNHPESARAWRMLGVVLAATDLVGSERAYRRALELAPGDASIMNNLAYVLVRQNRIQDALPLAQSAVKASSGNSAMLDTYAAALEGAGRCTEGLAFQRAAMERLPESTSTARRKQYTDRLAALETKCGTAAAAR